MLRAKALGGEQLPKNNKGFHMSKILFEKILTDVQSQLKINIETLAPEENISDIIENSLNKLSPIETNKFSPESRRRVYNEFMKYGPIEPLLETEDINEILINGPNSIWYETQGQVHQLQDQFYSNRSFDNFVHRICQETKIKIDIAQPTQNTQWRHFRVHMIGPPLTHRTCLSLRAHPTTSWSLERLHNIHWSHSQEIHLIRDLVQKKKSLLIIGPTGSGKTSVLNACLNELPPFERCLILEDTSEIALPQQGVRETSLSAK